MSQKTEFLVTQELRSNTKLSSRFDFYAKDAVFLVFLFGIVYMLKSLVAPQLQVVYWIGSIVVGIGFTIPSFANPRRKLFNSLMIFIERDTSVYHSVYLKEKLKEEETMNKKKEAPYTTDKILPIIRYDESYHCFECKYGYMNILQILTKDIVNASLDEIDYDIAKLTKYNKLEYEDYKILSLNFPCNTSEQQAYVKEKIERTSNPQFLKYLNNSLYELEWVQEKKSKREFYIMIFSDTPDGIKKMEADMKVALNSREQMITDMTREKKETILYRYNNPASILTGGSTQ